MNVTHNGDTGSPGLQAAIVEPILLSCVNNIAFYEINSNIKKIPTLKHTVTVNIIKKYLFYLVEYGLVLYDGQKHVFALEDGGFDLLNMIEEEKRQEKTDLGDIEITLE